MRDRSHAQTAQHTPAAASVTAVRIAVLSDIHGNLHALDAVLTDSSCGVDQVWCLGDLVGYGPRPNECVDLMRGRAPLSLCGNHDLAVLGALEMAEFSGDAAAAAIWTQGVLGDEQRAWLAGLEPSARADGVELFHGSPRDPVWAYVLSEGAALESLSRRASHSCSSGTAMSRSRCRWTASRHGRPRTGRHGCRPRGKRWLLNPGSVGQPRDGDPRAAWALIDRDAGRASFRRVSYRSSRRRPRSARRVYPRRSRRGWHTGSKPTL